MHTIQIWKGKEVNNSEGGNWTFQWGLNNRGYWGLTSAMVPQMGSVIQISIIKIICWEHPKLHSSTKAMCLEHEKSD